MRKLGAFIVALVLVAAFAIAESPGLITRGDLLKRSQYQTHGALNLFVDTTGDDNNDCSSALTPCLTLQNTISRVPKLVKDPVVVTLAAGNYAGAYLAGFAFDPATAASGASIQLTSDLVNVVPTTGTATGTATAGTAGSGTTFGTLTDGGQVWTVNDLRGKIIVITGGTGSGQKRTISSNTATVITIVGTWTAPTGTSTYAVQEGGANLTSPAAFPALPQSASTSPAALIIMGSVADMQTATAGGVFDIQQINVTSVAGGGVSILGPARVTMERCRINNTATSTNGVFLGQHSSITIQDSAFIVPSSAGSVGIGTASTGLVGLLRSANTLFQGSGAGVGISFAGYTGSLIATGNHLTNFTTHVSMNGGGFNNTQWNGNKVDCNSVASSIGYSATAATSSTRQSPLGIAGSDGEVSNCATAVSFAGPAKYFLMTGTWTGTGNTTAINVATGSRVQLSAASTITGTTELSIDGIGFTIADMRAATPRVISDGIFTSSVYE